MDVKTGSQYNNETESRYFGDLKNGERHGFGIFIWKSGTRYIGYWKNGKRHGKGTYIAFKKTSKWKEFHKFQGEWKEDDLPYGKETFRKMVYQGDFKDLKHDGFGIMTMDYIIKSEYKGSFEDGKCHGYGVMNWGNGNKFEGEWEKGKKVHGTHYYNNGNVFKGDYYDSKPEKGFLTANRKTFFRLWDENHNLIEENETDYIPPHEMKTLSCEEDIVKLQQENNTLRQIIEEKKEGEMNRRLCNVCMVNEINCIQNCGHFSFCSDCIRKVDKCPLCRENITSHIKFYL